MDWTDFWPVVKDVALGVLTTAATIVGSRYGYLKWVKAQSAIEKKDDRHEDRLDRNSVIKTLKELLRDARDEKIADEKRCEERIQRLENARADDRKEAAERIAGLESQIRKLHSDLHEVAAKSEQCAGELQELARHRDYYRDKANEAVQRNVRLHMELVSLRKRLGEPMPTSDPLIIVDPPTAVPLFKPDAEPHE